MEPVPKIATFHQEGHMKRYRLLAVAFARVFSCLPASAPARPRARRRHLPPRRRPGRSRSRGWASSPTETKLLRQVIRGLREDVPDDQGRLRADLRRLPGRDARQVRGPQLRRTCSTSTRTWRPTGSSSACSSRSTAYVAAEQVQDGKPFFPSLLNGFKYKGKKLYGFPKDWSPLAMETNNRACSRRRT